MKNKFLLLIVGLFCMMVTGCGGTGGGGGSPAQQKPMSKGPCPISQFSSAQIQNLIAQVTKDESPLLGGPDRVIQRSANLVFGMSQLNVTDSEILRSIQSGQFAALMSWFVDSPKNIDLERFSKCEEQ